MSSTVASSNLRVKTLEIRWHDQKPISSCDFQPRPLKRSRSVGGAKEKEFESYRLATAGEDHNVRMWMVHPNITPPTGVDGASATAGATASNPTPPRIEYLSTLSRHTHNVNVVRWNPSGDTLASAGDDGMIIIWAPSAAPSTSFGAEDDHEYDKEHWKPRLSFQCSTREVYDLAWSPTGEFIIAGGTDNAARIFNATDGKCVKELAEHSHFVQGVAWDPMNDFLATQSSDRSVHVYSVSTKSNNPIEVHAVGKNTRMTVKHARTPSVGGTPSRPRHFRRDSGTSEAESAVTSASIAEFREEVQQLMQQPPTAALHSGSAIISGPLTPSASIASTPSVSMFPPPPVERPSSRRSSFSSAAPGSPATAYSNRHARSPSPMPPLPAIRSSPAPATLASVKLYGDESFSHWFRRLTFSPDGGLLLTPSGHFEDPSVTRLPNKPEDGTPTRGRKTRAADVDPTSSSSVYIYSRLNFSRPPVGQIPGFKKPSVAVRFSPVLYELRGVGNGETTGQKDKEVKMLVVEPGREDSAHIDLTGPTTGPVHTVPPPPSSIDNEGSVPPSPARSTMSLPPPSLPPTPVTPAEPFPLPLIPTASTSQSPTPAPPPSSVFALPYRMLFAVATMDTVTIHDTQQAGPICLFTKLHYDEFTDMSWSPDGQCLMLTSRDGFCTIIIFDEPIPTHTTQQHALQLQSIAQSHTGGHSATHLPNPPQISTPISHKRPLTPAASDVSGNEATSTTQEKTAEPVKKKKRLELTKVGEIGS